MARLRTPAPTFPILAELALPGTVDWYSFQRIPTNLLDLNYKRRDWLNAVLFRTRVWNVIPSGGLDIAYTYPPPTDPMVGPYPVSLTATVRFVGIDEYTPTLRGGGDTLPYVSEKQFGRDIPINGQRYQVLETNDVISETMPDGIETHLIFQFVDSMRAPQTYDHIFHNDFRYNVGIGGVFEVPSIGNFGNAIWAAMLTRAEGGFTFNDDTPPLDFNPAWLSGLFSFNIGKDGGGPICGNTTTTVPDWVNGGNNAFLFPNYGYASTIESGPGTTVAFDLHLTPSTTWPYGLNPGSPIAYTTQARKWNDDGTLGVASVIRAQGRRTPLDKPLQ